MSKRAPVIMEGSALVSSRSQVYPIIAKKKISKAKHAILAATFMFLICNVSAGALAAEQNVNATNPTYTLNNPDDYVIATTDNATDLSITVAGNNIYAAHTPVILVQNSTNSSMCTTTVMVNPGAILGSTTQLAINVNAETNAIGNIKIINYGHFNSTVYLGNGDNTVINTNSGSISSINPTTSVSPEMHWASSSGIRIYGTGNNTVINSGSIDASTNLTEDKTGVAGIEFKTSNNNIVINSGSIDASTSTSTNATNCWTKVYGIYIKNGNGNNTIINSGSIDTGTSASTSTNATDDWTKVCGIEIDDSTGNNIITNSGSINVTRSGSINAPNSNDWTAGIEIENSTGNNIITNSGSIQADTSTNSIDNGIKVTGIEIDHGIGNNIITNSGSIQASSTNNRTVGIDIGDCIGDNTIINSGSIDASSTNNRAVGIDIGDCIGDNTIINSSSIDGIILDNCIGNNIITNSGNINSAITMGNGTITNSGKIANATSTGNNFTYVYGGGTIATGDVMNATKNNGALEIAADASLTALNNGQLLGFKDMTISNSAVVAVNDDNLLNVSGQSQNIGNFILKNQATANITKNLILDGILTVYGDDTSNRATLNLNSNTVNTINNAVNISNAIIKTTVKTADNGISIASIGNIVTTATSNNVNSTRIVPNFTGNLKAGKYKNNTVIQTGGLTSANDLSIEDSGMLDYSIYNSTSSIQIDITKKSSADLDKEGVNGSDVAAFEKAFTNDTITRNIVYNASTTHLKKIITEAHPESFAGATSAVLNAGMAAQSAVNNHVTAAHSTGLSSSSKELPWKTWGQFFGNTASESSHDNANGYDANTAGIIFGMDRLLTDNFRLGFAYTYMQINVDAKGSSNKNNINTNLITLYSDYIFGSMYLDGHVSYGFNHYDVDRYMTVLGKKATDNFGGYTLNMGTKFGRDFDLETAVITPFLGLDYTHIDTDSYTESGADISNLIIDGQDNDIFTSTLGVRFTATFGRFTPKMRASWIHDWNQEKINTNAKFATGGAALSSDAVKRDYDQWNVGLDLEVQVSDAFKLSLDCDYVASPHMHNFGGAFRAVYEF